MKTIIVISGRGSTGKTTSVIEIRKKILERGGVSLGFKPLGTVDFRDVMFYNEKKIAFLSMGDPIKEHLRFLELLAKGDVDIYICTSRTKGSTIDNVKQIASKYGYKIIRTSNYRGGKGGTMPNGLELNSLFADSIINLADNL